MSSLNVLHFNSEITEFVVSFVKGRIDDLSSSAFL